MEIEGISGSWIKAKASEQVGQFQRVDITIKVDGETYELYRIVVRKDANK